MSKIVKHYNLNDNNKIWRILITDSEKLILERRDTDAKEVFFAAYELENGSPLWDNFQFEEKFWIGIEKIHKDVMLLHKFAKPDLPGHQGIIAFDINNKEMLWENKSGAFAFVLDDKVYQYRSDFESATLEALDLLTGKETGERTQSLTEIENLRKRSLLTEDYSDYIFPEKFYPDEAEQIKNGIALATEGKKIKGEVEYALYDGLLMMSYHTENPDKTMRNIFAVLNLKTNEIIFEEVLNEAIDLFAADSFFVYKNFLFLIKEKKQLDVCKINGD